MSQMIHSRKRTGMKEERHDLFSNLLDAANENSNAGNLSLTDSELMGTCGKRC